MAEADLDRRKPSRQGTDNGVAYFLDVLWTVARDEPNQSE
jgi:hypothetical protein